MAIFNLLLFITLIYSPSVTTQTPTKIINENGGIATTENSTHISPPPPPPHSSKTTEFKPVIAIVVGVITIVFSITFLLLLYLKHCRTNAYAADAGGLPLAREDSGVNKKVIETLPMFRFSSLRGQKDGLECAVCLNRFEPEEVLRLLPKCKHAFHVECVDVWLDKHSTCPLCRYRVNPGDILGVGNSKRLYNHNHGDSITPGGCDHGKGMERSSPRLSSGRHSSGGERDHSLEIIVENSGHKSTRRVSFDSWNSRRRSASENRRPDLRSKSSFGWRSFRRKSGTSSENVGRRDGKVPVQGDKHRLQHRIVISDGGEAEAQRPWSNVQAAEVLYLTTEMILESDEASGRGALKKRSVSEITGMNTYRSDKGEREEQGIMKRWLDYIPQSQQQQATISSAPSSSSVEV